VSDHKNQNRQVIEWMRARGDITSLQAYDELGITRLARCINDIKNGRGCERLQVADELVDVVNRHGEKCRVKRYWLAPVARFDKQTGQGYLALP
jgi:hypothetical protein